MQQMVEQCWASFDSGILALVVYSPDDLCSDGLYSGLAKGDYISQHIKMTFPLANDFPISGLSNVISAEGRRRSSGMSNGKCFPNKTYSPVPRCASNQAALKSGVSNKSYEFPRAYSEITSVARHLNASPIFIGCLVPRCSSILEHNLSTCLVTIFVQFGVKTMFLPKNGASAARRYLCSLYGTVKTVASSMPKCWVAPTSRSNFALKENKSSEK